MESQERPRGKGNGNYNNVFQADKSRFSGDPHACVLPTEVWQFKGGVGGELVLGPQHPVTQLLV